MGWYGMGWDGMGWGLSQTTTTIRAPLAVLKTSKQAHKLQAMLLRNYDPPTHLLTGVRCRATGVAKNLNGEYVDNKEDDGDGVSSHLGSV